MKMWPLDPVIDLHVGEAMLTVRAAMRGSPRIGGLVGQCEITCKDHRAFMDVSFTQPDLRASVIKLLVEWTGLAREQIESRLVDLGVAVEIGLREAQAREKAVNVCLVDEQGREITDEWAAQRWAASIHEGNLWCPARGTAYVYDGRRYERDITMALEGDRTRFLQELLDWSRTAEGEPALVAAREAWAIEMQSARQQAALLSLTRQRISVDPAGFDRYPLLLNTPAGVLDLETGILRQHARADRLTRITGAAPDDHWPTPRWGRFLHEIFSDDEDLITWMQKAIGCCLAAREHRKLFVCFGETQNGKSTLLELLLRLWGDYAVASNAEVLLATPQNAREYAIAMLRGARLVLASETPKNALFHAPIVKQMTGGDTLHGRYPYGKPEAFPPTFGFWLRTNAVPRIDEDDRAMWERIVVIPFDRYFEERERERDLRERLLAEEGPGILAWAVEGYRIFAREGLRPYPKRVEEATRNVRGRMAIVERFATECLVRDPAARTLSSVMFASYRAWCDRERETPQPLGKFNELLAKVMNIEKKHTETGEAWLGVRLKDDPPKVVRLAPRGSREGAA
jgi:putative DNA primase/helicase